MIATELGSDGLRKSLAANSVRSGNSYLQIAWYNNKTVIILLHALAWFAIFSLPFLAKTSNNDPGRPPADNGFLYFYIVTRIFWVALFYVNALYLFPKLVSKKRYFLYFISQIGILFFLSVIHSVCFNLLVKKASYSVGNFLMFNTFIYLFILAASIAYKVVIEKIKSDKLLQERENANLKTELSFLRSQVSPHFMFNVLNNMVALARKQSVQLEPSLIKLSSLMRYMLYETDEQKVLLEKEIEYLQSYIDLQQQRFGKNVCINTLFSAIDGNYNIEPMLLIPFVENAFKHGTGLIEKAQIDIEMRAKNNILFFAVRNKYNPLSEEEKDKTSGIGLTNVKRRLNLLYGGNHTLLINKNEGWFTASLQLNLH